MQLFDDNAIEWMHLLGDETFDYPIDYWAAVLNARPDGHIDMLFKWESNSYCHFHRHLVATTTTVLPAVRSRCRRSSSAPVSRG